jgi:hypothetical protein
MTPDEKASLEMLIARNAESVKSESKKIKQAREDENLIVKTETVTNALSMGLTVEQSAKLANVSVEFVLTVQRQLSTN